MALQRVYSVQKSYVVSFMHATAHVVSFEHLPTHTIAIKLAVCTYNDLRVTMTLYILGGYKPGEGHNKSRGHGDLPYTSSSHTQALREELRAWDLSKLMGCSSAHTQA